MSYARWSEGDVYVYPDVAGYFNCMACIFVPDDNPENIFGYNNFTTTSRAELICHLHLHRIKEGQTVPERAFKILLWERRWFGDAFGSRREQLYDLFTRMKYRLLRWYDKMRGKDW